MHIGRVQNLFLKINSHWSCWKLLTILLRNNVRKKKIMHLRLIAVAAGIADGWTVKCNVKKNHIVSFWFEKLRLYTMHIGTTLKGPFTDESSVLSTLYRLSVPRFYRLISIVFSKFLIWWNMNGFVKTIISLGKRHYQQHLQQ